MNKTFFQLLSLWTLLMVWSGCGTAPEPESISSRQPNIVWLVAEDISPALACYGDPMANTPNIDQLCAEGIRFDQAFSTAPICAPSRSCLMSGLYATSMGTQHLRCEIPFSPQLETLPEYLSEAGYFTSNRNKTDYNFSAEDRWTHWSSTYAPWRQRTDDRPFYSFINIGPSHEGSVNRKENYLENVKVLAPEDRVDPKEVSVPPYYPDTELSREVWAHYYDMLQALDQTVGMVMDSLRDDGLLEETIVFFFGDHGFGMPRYKRWLYNTGLNVPLIIRVPEQFQHLVPETMGSNTDQMVSFVDFPPTVLQLAGTEIPATMEGQPFLGAEVPEARKYIYGARDRADDMFEMSRAVRDERYLYVRHFMPHLPYMQSGYIYSDVKEGFRALREARAAGLNNVLQEKIWLPKPVEELYDLQQDPQELNNLADDPVLADTKKRLASQLHNWMLTHRDLGLLPEAEYMARSAGGAPYDYARTGDAFQVEKILNTAEMVGMATAEDLLPLLNDTDSGVRYWAVMGLMNQEEDGPAVVETLSALLQDPSPSVRILTAEAMCRLNNCNQEAVRTLGALVENDEPRIALEAARSIQLVGAAAKPLVPTINDVLEKNLGEPGQRLKYKNFNYAAFTSWALEWALQEMGEEVTVN